MGSTNTPPIKAQFFVTPIKLLCYLQKIFLVMLKTDSSCLIMNTLPKQVKTVYHNKGVQGMQDSYRKRVKSSELEQTMKYVGFQPHHGERYNGECSH